MLEKRFSEIWVLYQDFAKKQIKKMIEDGVSNKEFETEELEDIEMSSVRLSHFYDWLQREHSNGGK